MYLKYGSSRTKNSGSGCILCLIFYTGWKKVSVKEPEPYDLVGPGAVTRCGSSSDGSGSDNGIKRGYEIKNDTICISLYRYRYHSVHIFSNIDRIESNEQDISTFV
jgi:hypothetical protein